MGKLQAEFKQFVKEQSAEEKIDNSNWVTCAIGEFAESKGWLIVHGFSYELLGYDCLDDFAQSLVIGEIVGIVGRAIKPKNKNEEVYDNLNNGFYKTYGELAQDLDDLWPLL